MTASGATVEVLLLRHGRTEVNAGGRLSGHGDVALDAEGEQQAAALGRMLAPRISAAEASGRCVSLVSSPLRRCARTAEVVAAECGLRPDDATGVVHFDDRFIEMDYGEWDGLPLADVPGETWRRWRSDPDFSPPGGERLLEVTRRVRAGLLDWVGRCDGGVLVVSSHVSPIKAAVICALGVDESVTWRMRLANASVTGLQCRIDSSGDLDATMTVFNETAHLGH